MSTYRPDIDGLRALCITSVVMFHAGFSGWSGGFVGVDIFFVISGFLITSLIGRQIVTQKFNLLDFYERRVRRLLAPTIPVIIVATLFALFFYTGSDFMKYWRSLIHFVIYGSNWFFMGETGYFVTPPEASPLLHTWSLSVEEQFYLVFPVLLLALLRFPRWAPWVLLALTGLSLAYSQLEIAYGSFDRAFFSSLSRFWEILLGALLALVLPAGTEGAGRAALQMRAVGLAMIAAAVFLYGPSTPSPGIAALLPVGGALLLLAASPDCRDPLCTLLASSPMVHLGKISYSLYLWHWPVLGATRMLVGERNDGSIVLAIALSVALAELSYRFVEQPIRSRRKLARQRDMAVLLAFTSTITVAIAAVGLASRDLPLRFPPEVVTAVERARIWNEVPKGCYSTINETHSNRSFCKFGKSPGHTIDLMLWGDSHAIALFAALRKYADHRGLTLGFAGRYSCPPLLNTPDSGRVAEARECVAFNNAVIPFIRDNDIPVVVLASFWANQQRGLIAEPSEGAHEPALKRTLDALTGRDIIIIEQVPWLKGNAISAYVVRSRLGSTVDTAAVRLSEHRERQRLTVEAMDRIALRDKIFRIDPAQGLCDDERCLTQSGGKLLYRDDQHLSVDGSLFLYPFLETELDRVLASRGTANGNRDSTTDAQ
jgi:peptidoglycan/LPS O-acetylase OafA/YrhL